MPPRNWVEDDIDTWPLDVGGTGALHDLSDQEGLPRLYYMKSVSRAAAWAMQDRPQRSQRRAGFIRPR